MLASQGSGDVTVRMGPDPRSTGITWVARSHRRGLRQNFLSAGVLRGPKGAEAAPADPLMLRVICGLDVREHPGANGSSIGLTVANFRAFEVLSHFEPSVTLTLEPGHHRPQKLQPSLSLTQESNREGCPS